MAEVETSSVYLLVSKDKPMFKIGKADDIIQRMDTLRRYWGNFDLAKSVEIKCHTKKVYKFEKILHLIFEDYGLELDENADGCTEWFDISCFSDVFSFVKETLSHHSDVYSVKTHLSLPKSPKPLSSIENTPYGNLTKEEKKIYQEEKMRKKLAQSFIENKTKIEKIVRTFSDNRRDILYFNRGLKHSGLIVFKSKNEDVENSLMKYRGLSSPKATMTFSPTSGSGPGYHYFELKQWDAFVKFFCDYQDGNTEYIDFLHDFYLTLEQDSGISNDYDQGISFLNDREKEFIDMIKEFSK